MKKLIIFTCCMFVTSMLLSFVVLPSISKAVQSPAASAPVSSAAAPSMHESSKTSSGTVFSDAEASSAPAKYVVKAYKGLIAVFRVDEQDPFKVLDVSVDSLPYADQDMLNKGIYVANDQELSSILEDYGS